jgi:uncharacterized protein YndB with AHSA1/START domain
VPRYAATRELLAPRDDVWRVVSDPYRLREWWPDIGGVQPDRRGFAPGARWQIVGSDKPSLLRRPSATGMLVVLGVEAPSRFAFLLTGDGMQVELRLEEVAADRTNAALVVEAPALIGLRRNLPRRALTRLHGLCQTAADF